MDLNPESGRSWGPVSEFAQRRGMIWLTLPAVLKTDLKKHGLEQFHKEAVAGVEARDDGGPTRVVTVGVGSEK